MCDARRDIEFLSKNPVSQPLLLTNAMLYAPEPLGPGSVLVEGGKIVAIGERPSGVESIDLGGAALGPGLIDLHTHGANGADVMDGGDAVARMARFFARHGVTGFVPSTVTASWEATKRAVESVCQVMAMSPIGAPTGAARVLGVHGSRVLGVHLEGPFLSPDRLGAQSPEHCILPTPESVTRLIALTHNLPVIVTLAPEVKGGMQAIRAFVRTGVVASIGHTVASTEEAEMAFAAGATQVTHLFNGMPPMHHRAPGVVGAALVAEGVRVELIADGVHLHPTTVKIAIAAKGVESVLLVTDSMAATGCADGEYVLGPMKVIVHDGEARLESGALAGSTLTLERAVVNVARWMGGPSKKTSWRSLGEAWQMASLNPARQLRLDDRMGRLATGYDADLMAMDVHGRVVLTMVGGEIVHRA